MEEKRTRKNRKNKRKMVDRRKQKKKKYSIRFHHFPRPVLLSMITMTLTVGGKMELLAQCDTNSVGTQPCSENSSCTSYECLDMILRNLLASFIFTKLKN